MTRAELVARMSPDEFLEWMVLERLEPFGEMADYLRTGLLASVLANIHRSADTPPFDPTYFFPSIFEKEEKPQTPEQIYDFMKMLQAAMSKKAGNA